MGRKIFVSYKYADYNVAPLDKKYWARDEHRNLDQTVYHDYKLNHDGTTD